MDDEAEQQLRMELMSQQIDHARLNMERLRQEMRWEPYKALAVIITAIVAVSGLLLGVYHLGAIHG
jgi:hypothetical protein